MDGWQLCEDAGQQHWLLDRTQITCTAPSGKAREQHQLSQQAVLMHIPWCITLFTVAENHHHSRFTALFRDHPGEPVPEENFWTLWCKGRLTETDTPTIRIGATPSGLSSAHLHHPRIFLQAACPSCCPTTLPVEITSAVHVLFLRALCTWSVFCRVIGERHKIYQ